jgi:purine-nucleoside phosphorylase
MSRKGSRNCQKGGPGVSDLVSKAEVARALRVGACGSEVDRVGIRLLLSVSMATRVSLACMVTVLQETKAGL